MITCIQIIRHGRIGQIDDAAINFHCSRGHQAYVHCVQHIDRDVSNFVTVAGRACFTAEQAARKIQSEVQRLKGVA